MAHGQSPIAVQGRVLGIAGYRVCFEGEVKIYLNKIEGSKKTKASSWSSLPNFSSRSAVCPFWLYSTVCLGHSVPL